MMNAPTPRRLVDSAQTPAEQQVALAASVAPRTPSLETWDEVLSRAAAPQRGPSRVAIFVASVLLGMGLMFAIQPSARSNAQAQVQVEAGAKWSRSSAQEVELQSGRLWMTSPSESLLRVRTPHGVLEIRHSRFLAEVTSNATSLTVEEGEVVLRAGGEVRQVTQGQSLTWPPAPTISPSLLTRSLDLDSSCSALEAPARRSCLERQTSGEGLDVEVSLYELGMLAASEHRSDDAVRAWRESLERFPEGVLHPEVRLALLVELVKARRFDEARAEAREFQLHCPDDPRLSSVSSLLSELR